jgi:hypothetical protein
MMLTLLLAWINAKYKYKYELLFVGTFLLDIDIIAGLVKMMAC